MRRKRRNLTRIYHLLYVYKVKTYIILILTTTLKIYIITFTNKPKWTQSGNGHSHFSVLDRSDYLPFSPRLHCSPTHTHISRLPPQSETSERSRKRSTVQASWAQLSFLLESFHGRAINWGQENLKAGDLLSLLVRTQPTGHPSHRLRECLMKLIWISGDLCSPRPLKWPGNVPILGKESSAYCGSIFK